jgi:hypothetical protein
MTDITDPLAFKAARMKFVQVTFQEGHLKEAGVNGCFVEDVIQVALDRLLFFQSQSLACVENDETIRAIREALTWQGYRRQARIEQGVANSYSPHESHHTFADEADVRHIYATK